MKIAGDPLFFSFAATRERLEQALPSMPLLADPVTWQIVRMPRKLQLSDLISPPDIPSVLLADTRTHGCLEKLLPASAGHPALLPASVPEAAALSPVILVFPNQCELAGSPDFPDFVADWLCMPLTLPDVIRRVVTVLKRSKQLQQKLNFGALTLLPQARALSYKEEQIPLTPTEFALAQLFLSQVGAIVPMSDLVTLFRNSSKSTEGSNIRVAVFQLRLKLEILTHSQYTLASVYRQGYCLKPKLRPPSRVQPNPGQSLTDNGNALIHAR